MLTRRIFIKHAGAAAVTAIALMPPKNVYAANTGAIKVKVFRSPSCGCCEKWATHLNSNGFNVSLESREDLTRIKKKLGVPQNLLSCHTAIVDGYIIEGHVPAENIKKLLEIRPEAQGLAVPGMPIGSPGMEMGTSKESYKVILFGADFQSIFARH